LHKPRSEWSLELDRVEYLSDGDIEVKKESTATKMKGYVTKSGIASGLIEAMEERTGNWGSLRYKVAVWIEKEPVSVLLDHLQRAEIKIFLRIQQKAFEKELNVLKRNEKAMKTGVEPENYEKIVHSGISAHI
jgi:hypothetical protein